MMGADRRPAQRAVARLVREIDEAALLHRADDDEFQEAAAHGRDVLAHSVAFLETLEHIGELTLGFMAEPAGEPDPLQLICDIFLLTRIALDPIEGVIEQ